jgi:HPt (histidine-containing phosphotransfer) domain-containing protein
VHKKGFDVAFRDLNGSVDFDYLKAYMAHDLGLVDEVLAIFQHQAELWSPMLDPAHEGWRDAAHTIKGAAAGIGAAHVAQLAGLAETGDDAGAYERLERVKTALSAALLDVAAFRHGQNLNGLKS